MNRYTRDEIQNAYIRVCRDSGFRMDYVDAAKFTGNVLDIPALFLWLTFGSLDIMKEIAAGTHPVCQKG